MAETNNSKPANTTPKANANAAKPANTTLKKIENMSNNEIAKLSSNNIQKLIESNTGNTSGSQKMNTNTNNSVMKKNNNSNLNSNLNVSINQSKPSNNQGGNNKPNNVGNKKNEAEQPSMLEKGLDTIGDTFQNIKNSITGTKPNNTKPAENNKNTSNKENNRNENNRESSRKESRVNESKRAVVIEEKEEKESVLTIMLKVVVLVVVLVGLYYLGKFLISKYVTANVSSPYLLNTTKNAKNALVVSQDSSSVNYIPIKKSEEQDGIQFTYSFWFLVENFDYKKGEWKHVFHKGNSSSYPNRAPGVWFHPDKNAIRVYMNTVDNILEYVDIDNIPIRKWVYMNIILNNRNLDLYINGYLKVRKELSSLPKQNDDDLWVSMFGGFEGYLSNIRYYSYAIDFNEINNNIKSGPSTNNCIDTGEIPPYLDDNWWFNYNV
jgi:hypothetical protein